eukprot:441256_1
MNKFKRKYEEWLQINNESKVEPLPVSPSGNKIEYKPSEIEITYARLSMMGFEHHWCMKAAYTFPNDVAKASEWIVEQQQQHDTELQTVQKQEQEQEQEQQQEPEIQVNEDIES